MKDYFRSDKKVRFIFPIDGDCINSADGRYDGADLIVNVRVKAPENAEIYINDKKAIYKDGTFLTEIRFIADRTNLIAVDRTTGNEDNIAVFKLKDAEKKFRLASDDNILFLKDLTVNSDRYQSLFDNPYLKMYQSAHNETGACVHLNLFYRTGSDEKAEGYFDLTMMTDKFKKEWEDNSDWLHLSFHSLSNEPLWPYKNTTYSDIYEDGLKTHKEILCFAGETSLSQETTIHFGAVNVTGVRALRSLGYKVLAGYFELDKESNPLVSYYYPKDLIAHVGERDFWKDTEEDMLYCRTDRVLNLAKSVDENIDAIKEVMKNKTRKGFIELMIHEQYFYPDYYAYIKDFGKIVCESCRYLKELGYTSTFLSETIQE